jgi:hypothetical protein
VKKLTVAGVSGIMAYSNEVINLALNSDMTLDFNVLVNCMLKA